MAYKHFGAKYRSQMDSQHLEIEHSGDIGTENSLVDKHTKDRWYSGYMHMSDLKFTHTHGAHISKDAVIGKVSDVVPKNVAPVPVHLHFIVYDRDGYSFSPWLLGTNYQTKISYTSDENGKDANGNNTPPFYKYSLPGDITKKDPNSDERILQKYTTNVDEWFPNYRNEYSDIIVVRGYYDKIENVLDKLGWQYGVIDNNGLKNYPLGKVQQLYINCGTDAAYDEKSVQKIKDFVEKGGSVYISDLASPFLEAWGLAFERVGIQQNVIAMIKDSGLKSYLGQQISPIVFDLGGWSVIREHKNASVLLTASVQYEDSKTGNIGTLLNSPLAILLRVGKGSVVYTTFHNTVQPNMGKMIEYFMISTRKTTEVNSMLQKYNISLNNLISSSANNFGGAKTSGLPLDGAPSGTMGTYFFKITDVSLSASSSKGVFSGESARISLYKPDGTLYKTASLETDSLYINVPASDNSEGEWLFKVDEFSGYSSEIMVIAASTQNTNVVEPRSGGNVVEPSSSGGGGGCNAGYIALAFLFVVPLFMKRK